mmetsp:Transcript_14414/g.35243  ORF Transcript_14414/g.35243 Transcript_14414/m.35243 type:complete len:86 (-) Transcript_14414:416-673(-)
MSDPGAKAKGKRSAWMKGEFSSFFRAFVLGAQGLWLCVRACVCARWPCADFLEASGLKLQAALVLSEHVAVCACFVSVAYAFLCV